MCPVSIMFVPCTVVKGVRWFNIQMSLCRRMYGLETTHDTTHTTEFRFCVLWYSVNANAQICFERKWQTDCAYTFLPYLDRTLYRFTQPHTHRWQQRCHAKALALAWFSLFCPGTLWHVDQGEWELNRQPCSYWLTFSTTAPQPPLKV